MDVDLSAKHSKSYKMMYEDDNLRKRKKSKKILQVCPARSISNEVPWGDLDDGIIERVLARLPVFDFFRFRSVCKGWSYLTRSPSFLLACREVLARSPWFYMWDSKSADGVLYDTDTSLWHRINFLASAKLSGKWIPVAAAGGLICFRSAFGNLTVRNPLTGSCRELPALKTENPIHAITIHMNGPTYRITVISGENSSFGIKVFLPLENCWTELPVNGSFEDAAGQASEKASADDETAYVLDGSGLAGASDLRRNTAKEFSAVPTISRDGREIIYFLNGSGRVVACDTSEGAMYAFPAILPPEFEYSVDLVECGGRVLLVVLLEMMESATIRVWEFRQGEESEWTQVLAMPPAMSKAYYGKKADINCVGHGDFLMVCINSRRFHRVVLCNVTKNSWVELPRCYVPSSRKIKRFASAFAFEPRIEACV